MKGISIKCVLPGDESVLHYAQSFPKELTLVFCSMAPGAVVGPGKSDVTFLPLAASPLASASSAPCAARSRHPWFGPERAALQTQ